MQRSEFIKTCCLACLSGSAIVILLQGCTSTNHFALSTFENNKLTINKNEFVITGKKGSAQRKYVIVKTEKLYFPIYLFKISENNYSALLMECSHKGCELQTNGNFLVCPCHGSEFNNLGFVQNPPAEENLKKFKTTTDHENIFIQF